DVVGAQAVRDVAGDERRAEHNHEAGDAVAPIHRSRAGVDGVTVRHLLGEVGRGGCGLTGRYVVARLRPTWVVWRLRCSQRVGAATGTTAGPTLWGRAGSARGGAVRTPAPEAWSWRAR